MNFEMFEEVFHNFGKPGDKTFSEKMLISTRCIHGFMSKLIKKSWTDSNEYQLKTPYFWLYLKY